MKVLKWIGLILGGLVVLVLIALGVIYLRSNARMNRMYAVEPAPLVIPEPDSATLARGKHLAETRACTECHGGDLSGVILADDPALGLVRASNLTSGEGGIGAAYADVDWVRATRHGVSPEGRPLILMPSHEFAELSREDLGALLAYVRQVPPVDNVLPENRLGPVARILLVTGQLPLLPAETIDHLADYPVMPEPGVTPAYGEYLAAPCRGCHGADLAGAQSGPPGTPPASSLRGLPGYTEAGFFRAVREGVRPSGDTLHTFMPRWHALTDDEVKAIWAHVQTLRPLVAESR